MAKYDNMENKQAVRMRLETEYDVIGHPKAQKVWDLAWEHGHSCGYQEVANYYDDFVQLIK